MLGGMQFIAEPLHATAVRGRKWVRKNAADKMAVEMDNAEPLHGTAVRVCGGDEILRINAAEVYIFLSNE